MIYGVSDKPPILKLIGFSLQQTLACFTATVLIAQVCGVEVSAALVGAGLATILYAIVTKFKSPMILSNSGAFVAPVLAALLAGGYTAVAIGGVTSAIVYCCFGFIFTKISADNIYKVLPKVLIGTITIVIGVNLMGFIPSYIGDSQICVILALITMFIIAMASRYLKGTLSLFPFLIGTLFGYIISIPFGLVDFSKFENISFIQIPTFAFTKWAAVDFKVLLPIIFMYIAYTISAMCECLSDHAALGNIIDKDLYTDPGLGRIFIGEGIGNIATSFIGGLGACSYGEGIGAIGFSKCASIYSVIGAAIIMIMLGFIGPVQAFVASIPSCIIGGANALILYGVISNSGIKRLQEVDFSDSKNLIICSAVLSVGICGIVLGNDVFSLTSTALALVVGVILNIILK